ncbi:hypothetical protein [Helicobacter kayseriensis]|uniref:hypothetical protein n=1 Tax=Helicobacter kayseriensis TaxID=2905877 RepID=UPI001E4B0DF5|nr:hypothetical protein [Helicobacter kayseriensis]MCE3047057.1 hypothetical protein [Helicobacter kayseriensis]MCE3048283.1 hypothetical protein [Helicobacter kayseriensis]
MRRAFGILESLFALMVFSLLILVCSKLMLQIQKDLHVYDEMQRSRSSLANAIAYLQKALQYAIIESSSKDQITYYEVNRLVFFSSSFSPAYDFCDSERIPRWGDIKYFGLFSSDSVKIARVIREEKQWLILDQKVGCRIAVPLGEKRRVVLRGDGLYVDQEILLEGVKKFEFSRQGDKYKIQICQVFCMSKEFLQNEIVYEF